jgi:ribonuclease III
METELAALLGISFQNPQLLAIAMTHRSLCAESPDQAQGLPSNERLEFLGDAILNYLTASWLYHTFPEYSEGDLSAMRAALVKRPALSRFARSLHLGTYARISRNEESRAARQRDAFLADLFEAVLGAIYLDQGIEVARTFVHPFLEQEAAHVLDTNTVVDHRTRLQRKLQAQYGITPIYDTIDASGPDHKRLFTVAVLRNGEQIGVGSGSSKQAAAQEAARLALETLERQSNM